MLAVPAHAHGIALQQDGPRLFAHIRQQPAGQLVQGHHVIAVGDQALHAIADGAIRQACATVLALAGRGIGELVVLDHALAEARDLGCETLATASYIDSRYEPAVRLLESAGMVWADPDNCNMTMLHDPDAPPAGKPVLPPGFSLRTWQPGDEVVWTRLKNEAFGDDTPLGWWERVFGEQPWFDPRGWHFCMDGDRPVGISAAVLPRHPETGELLGAQIDWVGMLADYRGLGLGRALVVACINFALQFRPDLFVLITQRFRTSAVALYESLGFRAVMDWRHYRMAL